MRIVQSIALALFGVALGLGLIEIGLRMVPVHAAPAPVKTDPGLKPFRTLEDFATPGNRGLVMGEPYEVNAAGFRGPVPKLAAAPGTWRLVITGDSVTAAVGLPLEESYGSDLERMLRARGERVEVINLGIPGGHAISAVDRYEMLGARYHPDVTVYGWTINDIEGPHYRAIEKIPPKATGFLVLDAILPELRSVEELVYVPPGTYTYEVRSNWFDNPEAWADFTGALDRFKQVAPCPVIFLHPHLIELYPWHPYRDIYAKVTAAAEERGIPVINGFSAVEWRWGQSLWVSDPHPNAEGHRLLAGALAEGLSKVPCVRWAGAAAQH